MIRPSQQTPSSNGQRGHDVLDQTPARPDCSLSPSQTHPPTRPLALPLKPPPALPHSPQQYQSAAVWAADVHPMMRTRARPRTDLPPLEPPITLVVREPPALWAPVAPEIGPDGEELTKLPPVVQVCVNFPCWQALMKLQRDYSHVEV